MFRFPLDIRTWPKRRRRDASIALIAALTLPLLVARGCDCFSIVGDDVLYLDGKCRAWLWLFFDQSDFDFPPGPARIRTSCGIGAYQVAVHTNPPSGPRMQRGLVAGFPLPVYKRLGVPLATSAPWIQSAVAPRLFSRLEIFPLFWLFNAASYGLGALLTISCARFIRRHPRVPVYIGLVLTTIVALVSTPLGTALLIVSLAFGWLVPAMIEQWRQDVIDRRVERGLCVKCAYDLAGLDSRLCPECGTQNTGAKHAPS
jgi:hypothetical protein